MIKSSIKIAISADSRKTTLKKEIFFIGSNDNKRFPDVYHQNEEIQPLVVFGNAIAQAKESLLIIDAYIFKFDDAGERKKYIEYIFNWIDNNWDIKKINIITGAYEGSIRADIEKQLETNKKKINSDKSKENHVQIEICFTRSDYFNKCIHDRFAIIDKELWHFGATVGGFHRSISAVSRGWDAVESGAITFFESLWLSLYKKEKKNDSNNMAK